MNKLHSQSLQKRLNIYWLSQRHMTWLSHRQSCRVGDVLQAIYTLPLAPVLGHDAACKPLPENHFFAPTLSNILTATGHTCLLHQMSRNFWFVFLILCFPNTWGLRHTAPSNNWHTSTANHKHLCFGHLTYMHLVSAVRHYEVSKKEGSRKHAERYQISELGMLFAPSPHLTGFRKNKEQAVDWIKSCDRAELCLLEIITFFTIYTVAIYWYPVLDPCILHGHNNSNKLVFLFISP